VLQLVSSAIRCTSHFSRNQAALVLCWASGCCRGMRAGRSAVQSTERNSHQWSRAASSLQIPLKQSRTCSVAAALSHAFAPSAVIQRSRILAVRRTMWNARAKKLVNPAICSLSVYADVRDVSVSPFRGTRIIPRCVWVHIHVVLVLISAIRVFTRPSCNGGQLTAGICHGLIRLRHSTSLIFDSDNCRSF